MASVRSKEEQAEWLAHVLDDAVHLPHTRIRFGLDPIMGLVPIVGDLVATIAGSFVLVAARQLGAPTVLLLRMAYYQSLNGLIGSVPLFGDLFSFTYKSNAKNAALMCAGSSAARPESVRWKLPRLARPISDWCSS